MKVVIGFILGVMLICTALVMLENKADADPVFNGRVSWTHADGHWGNVQVENHASNYRFRVRNAVKVWGSGLHYGGCRKHVGCVKIFGRNQGNNGYIGTSYYHFRKGNYKHFWYIHIYLNRYYAYEGLKRLWQAALHELGHSLGLDHDNSGCMVSVDHGDHYFVSHQERRYLAKIYGRT